MKPCRTSFSPVCSSRCTNMHSSHTSQSKHMVTAALCPPSVDVFPHRCFCLMRELVLACSCFLALFIPNFIPNLLILLMVIAGYYTCIAIYLSIYLSCPIYLCTCVPIYPSTYLSTKPVNLSISVFVSVRVFLPVSLPACLPACLPVLSVCLCLCIYRSVSFCLWHIYIYIHTHTYICIHTYIDIGSVYINMERYGFMCINSSYHESLACGRGIST